MSIQLVTYANQTVTPTNDAIIYEKAIDQNGIFYGCNVTVTSNAVNITGGYGIVCGREFVINSESITVTLAPSGTLQGRLYVRLDLADADAPIQLLTATGNTLPPLEQDNDVNFTNGVYEMELATFTVGVSALSDVVETYEIIEGSKSYTDSIFSEVTDYVTEISTSGNWTYRKYNSGAVEAWYQTSGSLTIQTAAGSLYQTASNATITLPSSLFTSVEYASVMLNYGSWGAWTYIATISTTDIQYRAMSASSRAGTTYGIRAYVKGSWK